MSQRIPVALKDRTYGVGDQRLVVIDCCRCGVLFAMPESLDETARKHSQKAPGFTLSFYCPNGHVQSYVGENREQRLEAQLERERNRSGRLAHERDQIEASRRAQKAAATRARNEKAKLAERVKNGVCPCCGRTFKQLARHMKSQHPEYPADYANVGAAE